MIAWRICKKKRAATALNGKGSADFPGRWNAKGEPMVYLASTRALAALEVLAHVEDRSLLSDVEWVTIPVEIDDAHVIALKVSPVGWDSVPASDVTVKIGSAWFTAKQSVALRVPSVVIRGEWNYLFNPGHPEAGHVKVGAAEDFKFDPRIASEHFKSK